MAITYTVSDALNIANRNIPRPVEADHASYIANIALNEVWHAYDWRVSLESLTPFWCIPLVQDYGPPFYSVPLDFFGLREAYLIQNTATPTVRRDELKIIKNIRKEFVRGLPRNIGYAPETQSFRIYPQIPENIGATQFMIDGYYKKLAPQTTPTTLQSTFIPWDDIYLQNFVKALKWAAKETADAPEKDMYKQSLYAALAQMAEAEGLNLGDNALAPAEPLVGGIGVGYFPGINGAIF